MRARAFSAVSAGQKERADRRELDRLRWTIHILAWQAFWRRMATCRIITRRDEPPIKALRRTIFFPNTAPDAFSLSFLLMALRHHQILVFCWRTKRFGNLSKVRGF